MPLQAAARRHPRTTLFGGVFLLAFAIRAVYLAEIHDAPVFDLVSGDGKYFLEWSREIVAGQFVGSRTYMVPLYAYLLAAIQAILGPGLLGIKAVQIGIGSASCGILALGVARASTLRTGLVAGLLLAIYPPAIFSDAIVQKSVLDVFLTATLLLAVAGMQQRPDARGAAMLGLVLGGLGLVRENTLVFIPVLVGWIGLQRGPRDGMRLGAVLVLAVLAALAPWAMRNLAVTGELYATTHNFGMNLYLGNRVGAVGIYEPVLPGRGSADVEWQDAVRLAEASEGRPLRASEVSRHWARRGLADIASDPLAWGRLLARKALLYLAATERMDTEDQYSFEEESRLLRGLGWVIGFGALLPLAVFGGIVTWRRSPQQRVVWALAAIYSASVVFFYVTGRYRLPAAVLLTFPAALGIVALPSLVREGAFGRLAAGLGGLLMTAALCFLPLRNHPLLDPTRMRASTALNLGLMKGRTGDVAASEASLRRAIGLHPAFVLAHQSLAQLLAYEGRLEEAESSYRAAVAAQPDFAPAHRGLGELLLQRGRAAEAVPHLEQALALDPSNAKVRANLREARRKAGAPSGAAAPYE